MRRHPIAKKAPYSLGFKAFAGYHLTYAYLPLYQPYRSRTWPTEDPLVWAHVCFWVFSRLGVSYF